MLLELDSLSPNQLLQLCRVFKTQIDLATHLYTDITMLLVKKLVKSISIGDDGKDDKDDYGNNKESLKNITGDCIRHLQSTLHSLKSESDGAQKPHTETSNLLR